MTCPGASAGHHSGCPRPQTQAADGCSPWCHGQISSTHVPCFRNGRFCPHLAKKQRDPTWFFYRFIISSQCKKSNFDTQPIIPLLTRSWRFFGIWMVLSQVSHSLWIPWRSRSRQGLFTSEQKADPTPRLFVPLSCVCARVFFCRWVTGVTRKKKMVSFFHDIYPWMWEASNTVFSDKRSTGITVRYLLFLFIKYHCVISMVSRYLAWDHFQ